MAPIRRLVYSFDNLIWAITGMESEFDSVLKSTWATAVDGGHLNYRLDGASNTRIVDTGSMNILILILMNRFTNRREPLSFRAVDEPCPVNEFNFTKVKSSEKLFQISFQDLGNCCGLVVANASPFMVGHSLIVPNPEELLNQVLRKSPLQLALQTILLSADTSLCLGFNSLLAHASVNHLHFHLWYSTHRLFASVCPTRKKSSLPFYDELDWHPVDNFVLEFRTPNELQVSFGRLWALVKRCQEMRIAHNLFAARNITGALRVVLWLRRSVYGSKAYQRHSTSRDQWTFSVAVTELAGMFVVPDEAAARPLSLPGSLCEIYIDERLDRQEIARLEASLISSVT